MTEQFGDRLKSPLDDQSLVAAYRNGEVAGELVMARVLEKISLSDRSEEILTRKDGSTLTNSDGHPLRAVDYLEVAGKHGATQFLLGLLMMPETDPGFEVAKETIGDVVRGYLPPIQPQA